MEKHDGNTVLTLDAGGTNFVFSAINNNKEIVEPYHVQAHPDDLDKTLASLVFGFKKIIETNGLDPVAISFAFPGPADYPSGIIGDLPNFPSFRGGVAMGPYLQDKLGLPVFINNDGDLFAYGEALAGSLIEINKDLESAGNPKRYQNLLGITLGTGFGAGAVINNNLLVGDNSCGGDIWLSAHKYDFSLIAEEGVSIRAVKRLYNELADDKQPYTPKDIFDIADGLKDGNREAAIKSFETLGEIAGFSISESLNMIDGLVVIGGGISKAYKYILPAMVKEMNGSRKMINGTVFPRLQMKAFDLSNQDDKARFFKNESKEVKIPGSDKTATYFDTKKTGVMVSSLGASKAISIGAYNYAINQLGL